MYSLETKSIKALEFNHIHFLDKKIKMDDDPFPKITTLVDTHKLYKLIEKKITIKGKAQSTKKNTKIDCRH